MPYFGFVFIQGRFSTGDLFWPDEPFCESSLIFSPLWFLDGMAGQYVKVWGMRNLLSGEMVLNLGLPARGFNCWSNNDCMKKA